MCVCSDVSPIKVNEAYFEVSVGGIEAIVFPTLSINSGVGVERSLVFIYLWNPRTGQERMVLPK